jgi:hypothetical protein
MIIYKTVNLINGKFYIGKDSKNNPEYFGSGILLIKAIKKYGKDNFKKEVIEVCDSINDMNQKEKYWISFYNSTDNKIGYNISEGGEGGKTRDFPWNKGKNKENNESIRITGEKNSVLLTGRKQTPETIDKRRKSSVGRKRTECQKEKISRSLKGRSLSEETREKISSSLKGKKWSDDQKTIMTGRRLSDSTKEKIGNKLRGKKYNTKRSGKNSPFYKEIQKEVIDSIISMRMNSIPFRKISKEFGISISLIYRILNEARNP